jgi:uncharacterized oxidoreductase
MTANISKILILGATSGLGEQFARYFHSKGKKVIAAGRRTSRLASLQSSLPGLETLQIDVEDLSPLSPPNYNASSKPIPILTQCLL